MEAKDPQATNNTAVAWKSKYFLKSVFNVTLFFLLTTIFPTPKWLTRSKAQCWKMFFLMMKTSPELFCRHCRFRSFLSFGEKKFSSPLVSNMSFLYCVLVRWSRVQGKVKFRRYKNLICNLAKLFLLRSWDIFQQFTLWFLVSGILGFCWRNLGIDVGFTSRGPDKS